jgi:hypothetical protein
VQRTGVQRGQRPISLVLLGFPAHPSVPFSSILGLFAPVFANGATKFCTEPEMLHRRARDPPRRFSIMETAATSRIDTAHVNATAVSYRTLSMVPTT